MFIWLDKTEFYDTRCLGTDPCEGALGNTISHQNYIS